MQSRCRRLAYFITLAFCVALAAACSDNSSGGNGGNQGCTNNDQCAADEVCLQGECVFQQQSQCTTAADCPAGPYECANNVCRRTDFDAGTTDAGSTADTNVDQDVFDDVGNDNSAPSVQSTTPADGDKGVALDTTIKVVFSEAMDPFSINFYSLTLRDANNRDVTTTVDYDDATHTATITPQAPLRAASSYRVKVDSLARDPSGNGVSPEFTATFYTAYDEPSDYTALAKTYAPVIYQGIADTNGAGPNGDIPTRIDFDGDQNAANNSVNSQKAQTKTKASVYYNVTETPQYYFLHYILYYPSRYDADAHKRSEHDFAGVALVVDKASGDLLMADGVQLMDSGDATLAYKPSGSGITLPGGGVSGRTLDTFDASKLEDGTHYPMFVPAGIHYTCNWVKSGANGRCLHNAGQFQGANGVVLRAGDTAQSYDQATANQDTGIPEMSYKLVPLAKGLWALRGSYASDGLFEVPFVYTPLGDTRPVGYTAQQPHVLPRRLQSDADTSFGRTPFYWLPSAGKDNQGQWLLDPVYILSNRYNFGQTVKAEYCYNFFFDIDHRSDGAVPGCGSN